METDNFSGTGQSALSFNLLESRCEETFAKYPEIYHLSTPEDFPLLFKSESDYKAAMTIIGITARMHPDVVIFTFEWMSNHLHTVLAASRNKVMAFFKDLERYLFKYLQTVDPSFGKLKWGVSLREVTNLSDFRNVIAYDNRNAYVVLPNTTPFTYRWGANKYFFSDEASLRCHMQNKHLTVRQIRALTRTHKTDAAAGLAMIDGYVSPSVFCAIDESEKMFRSARHYFYKLSRDIESQGKIAKELGERVYYVDDELYSVISALSNKQYGQLSPATLDKNAKIDMARTMHYDYNASNKQISRILRLDIAIVDSLFPTKAH